MSFQLNIQTCFEFYGTKTKAIDYFLNVLKRDIIFATKPLKKKNLKESVIKIYLENKKENLKPEQFIIKIEKKEMKINAPDELGIIYAILYISEKYLNIDKFWFWNDIKPYKQLETIKIEDCFYKSFEQKTRFRGWFINDEVLISKWKIDNSQKKVWRMIFETLLRCGGNMVIPGTDLDNSQYKKLASEMGLWLTQHHAEPLGAKMFSRVYPDKLPSYTINKNLFQNLWRDSVEEHKGNKVIWNVGFRGQGDHPFWFNDPDFDTDEKRGELIENVIKDQIKIISTQEENPICCVNIYGEITELYKKGFLNIPSNVIKIWADSGYGKMVSRRQENHNPRIPSIAKFDDKSLHGIYYHVTFYDLQASNHLTMLPNTADFVNKELNNAFDHMMNDFLIVNCGNIRPHTYYLDLVSQIWRYGNVDTNNFNDYYFSNYYEEYAGEFKKMYNEFQNSIINYGKFVDERAGEQLYFYCIRNLSHNLIQNSKSCELLWWLTEEISINEQIDFLFNLSEKYIFRWKKLCNKLEQLIDNKIKRKDLADRIWNQFALQVFIHHDGIIALNKFIKGYKEYLDGNLFRAFIYFSQSEKNIDSISKKMKIHTSKKWKNFYKNDCLTNISLVHNIVVTVKKYIRMLGDGPNYYNWEREYIMDKSESSISLLTNKTKQLNDELLYEYATKKIKFED